MQKADLDLNTLGNRQMSEYKSSLLNLHVEKRENHTAVNTKLNKHVNVWCVRESCWVHRHRLTFANERQRKEEVKRNTYTNPATYKCKSHRVEEM